MSNIQYVNNLKILFLNAYFYPENYAFSHLEQDIIDGLVHAGCEITVICPTPSRGVPKEDDSNNNTPVQKFEEHEHIHIQRYWAPKEGKNPLIRAFRYFWCNLRGYWVARRHRDTDVVFTVSTPPTQGLFAGKLAKKLHVPFVYSVQDVFPDSLVTSGLAKKNSLLYKIGSWVAKKSYSLCTKIIVLSETVRRTLIEKGVEDEKMVTINNWIDAHSVRPIPRNANPLFDQYHIDRDKFIVVYAGNFGAAQGAEVIIEAAEKLRDNPDICFAVFGGGAEYERAEKMAEEMELPNVVIHPLLPLYKVSEAYSLGDIALVTCKKGVSKIAMPSKTWSIMACNTPIIASYDTESDLAEILKISGAGTCVEPEDPDALAAAIEDAYEHRDLLKKQVSSHSPRMYVIKNVAKNDGVDQYIKCLKSTVAYYRGNPPTLDRYDFENLQTHYEVAAIEQSTYHDAYIKEKPYYKQPDRGDDVK